MTIPQKLAAIGSIITAKNSNGGSSPMTLANQFLRNGNRRELGQDWSSVLVNDEQLYSGYIYAAIRNRANGITKLAAEFLKTDADPKTMEEAKKNGLEVRHPYLPLIDSSKTFSNYELWYELSTYLDLEGVYYLMAVRTVVNSGTDKVKVGNVQSFSLLNPYDITPILKKDSLDVAGYIENRKGFRRAIPKEMIIEIRDLNPFDKSKPYSLTDAAKDYQYTIKQSGDFTRQSLRNNMAAPGIISTGVVLSDEDFIRFQDRIKSTEKGQPLFGNGSGAIDYKSMQTNLDNAALEKISAINVEALLAVTGMSKTMLGIEVSGVTRDTSRVQSDLFVSMQNMPRLQLIIDAFNQDYKNYYAADFEKNKYRLYIDSPLGTDREAEKTDITNRKEIYNLCTTLVNEGYDIEAAARYAQGEITLEELGEPTKEPKKELDLTPTHVTDTGPSDTLTPDPAANSLRKIENALDSAVVTSQEGALQSTVMQIEARVAAAVGKKVTNAYDSQGDVISGQDRQENERDLETALLLFYAAILPVQAASVMRDRVREYSKPGTFTMTPAVQQEIKASSQRAAQSHMDTILQDFLQAVQVAVIVGGDTSAVVEAVKKAYPEESAQVIVDNLRTAAEKASRDANGAKEAQRLRAVATTLNSKYKDSAFEDLLAGVRKAALAGANQTELRAAIRQEYADISKTRAKVIAKTETNRAFTAAQFQADKQFLSQNGLTAKKQWVCNGPRPCVFCLSKQAEGPIPFDAPFVEIGDMVNAKTVREDGMTTVHAYKITYEDVYAGDIHPNGNCSYQLVLE